MSVADGESSDTATVTIPLPEIPEIPEPTEHIESNLSISGSYLGDYLTLTVADGESQDTTQIFIDAEVINRPGGGDVNCDNIANEIQDCCTNLSQDITDCCLEILSAINILSEDVRRVENELTTEITQTINTDYECVEDEETQILKPELKPVTYTNKPLTALFEHLVIMNKNLDSIYKPICKFEGDQVVSIVASDKVIPNATGKFLILHFVTEDNYPKRSRNSTYWPVQIPAALDSYSWEDDFLNLRFERGNQYAELRFNEFKNPVSGFFANKQAAETYFDAVLDLTTATEKNRVYPEHKTPQTSVTVRLTRPYRAFIESVNDAGQAVCHVKYTPKPDPE